MAKKNAPLSKTVFGAFQETVHCHKAAFMGEDDFAEREAARIMSGAGWYPHAYIKPFVSSVNRYVNPKNKNYKN